MNLPLKWTLPIAFTLILGFLIGFLFGLPMGVGKEAESLIAQSISPVAQSQTPPPSQDLINQFSSAFEAASLKVSPSVVSIIAEQEIEMKSPFGFPDDAFKNFFGEDLFRRFFNFPPKGREQKRTVRSLGSGVIVTEDGYILTNNHVVEKATKLRILLQNDKDYEAEVVGTDPPTDVAVIKIDAHNLPVAFMGNSKEITVGQWVIAVGNPFQLSHTVTAGIISATGRSSVGLAEYEDFIQTDASINPGNSGGALADLNGNVIRINTAIASPSGGNIGIGFAIPIKMAKHVMDALISKGKVVRGYIGIWLQDITDDLAEALDLEQEEGVLVADVASGGPAERAGIERGDVIVEFNGEKIQDGAQLQNKVAMTEPGTEVTLKVIRDGDAKNITLDLTEKPLEREQRRAAEGGELKSSGDIIGEKLGIDTQTLTPDIARQLGYQGEKGVVVTTVNPGSPAAEAGLQRGDLIQEINRKEVASVDDLEEAIRGVESGDTVALLVRRGRNTFFAAVEIK